MCNEYVVMNIDGVLKWVRLAIGGGGQIVGDFDPEDPEVVQFTSQPLHSYHPTPDAIGPVIRLDEDGRFDYVEMRWGFPPPSNAKPPLPVTNIRNLDSPYWRKWLTDVKYRCLVPFTAFCEWTSLTEEEKAAGVKKERRWFRLKEDTPAMFAGIWCEWDGPRGPKKAPIPGPHLLYAFITTEPNEIVGEIHPKAMPVILTRDKWMKWLKAPWPEAKELVATFPDEGMEPAAKYPPGATGPISGQSKPQGDLF
jgi:putative SOS response-associated peptidase YedK